MPSPEEIVISVTAAAIAISKDLSPDDTAFLSLIFTQLGDTLATLSTVKQNAISSQDSQQQN